MEWSNYLRSLEHIYKIEFDSTLKNTIKNYFTEELSLFTEQDMFERTIQTRQSYGISKIKREKIK